MVKVIDTKGYEMSYQYDQYGRNNITSMTLPGLSETHVSEQRYDQFGRAFQSFDSSSNQQSNGIRGTQTIYNEYGFVKETRNVRQNGGTAIGFYERILETDARGNVTKYVLGNGVIVNKYYNYATGWLESVKSLDPFTYQQIQDLQYEWDTIGNLTYRRDFSGSKNLEDSFSYDALNRLTKSVSDSLIGENIQSLEFDEMGNITYKSDVGNYTYGTKNTSAGGDAGPHAVIQAGDAVYQYDNNGNNTEGDGRSLIYSTFDKVIDVNRGTNRTTFAYGPERSRYKREDTDSAAGGTNKTTYYLGSVEFIKYTKGERAGDTEYKRQIGMALETILYQGDQFVKEETHFLLSDHLGSTDVITDTNGEVKQEMSFDAWGQRRNASNWLPLELQELVGFDTNITTQGYTGHEMVDGVGIIHMNGRIYDPMLARFLQADPNIQEPYNTQSLNRYSYVINNPLNKTDPTGYFFGSILASAGIGGLGQLALQAFYFFVLPEEAHGAFNTLFIVALSAGCPPCGAGVIATAAATTTFHSTFAQTGDLGQSVKAGAIAGYSSYAFSQIGAAFEDASTFTDFAAFVGSHGIVGGVMSELQGGNFGDGFISAGVGKIVTLAGGAAGVNLNDTGKFITTVLAGGTASELTGGKFANGAATAGLAFAANFLQNNGDAAQDEEFVYDEDLEEFGISEDTARSLSTKGVKYAVTSKRTILKLTTSNLTLQLSRQGAGLINVGLAFLDSGVASDVLNYQTRLNINRYQNSTGDFEGAIELRGFLTNGQHLNVVLKLAENGYTYQNLGGLFRRRR